MASSRSEYRSTSMNMACKASRYVDTVVRHLESGSPSHGILRGRDALPYSSVKLMRL